MFYIDLDEIDMLAKKFWMISRNKFNFFSFRDKEHLQFPAGRPDQNRSTKEHIIEYLRLNNFVYSGQKIMLLTNLNILGYNFNPVSFYFILDKNSVPECAIAEVSNTFREMKPYFFPKETFKDGKFHLNTTKYFYVSPFIDHDANFDFTLQVPGEKLNIKIDDYKNERRFFISTLTGQRKEITNSLLVLNTLRFPLLTLRIMTLIHWNALKLWLKKIPYHKKENLQELQRDVYNKK
jgi:DUF1365 family protein